MKTTVMQSLNLCGVAAAVLLAGCSATHVGESWQCPLAQGTSCASIAEADPAVPASAARPALLFGEPLHEARRRPDRSAACSGGCGPLAWLSGLFGAGARDDAPPPSSTAPAPAAATGTAVAPAGVALSTAPAPATDTSFRVPEVLGRIWIAPFVDADGIYREAHWVRVVLEPAGWKLP